MDVNSEQGNHFVSLYAVDDEYVPCIFLIDPRSKGVVRMWEASQVLQDITSFIDNLSSVIEINPFHPSEDGNKINLHVFNYIQPFVMFRLLDFYYVKW